MAVKTMGVSEARRLFPHIVRTVASEGGRVDVTLRGESRVSIVRTAEITGTGRHTRRPPRNALCVELNVPADSLIDVVRALRARVGRPRARRTVRRAAT